MDTPTSTLTGVKSSFNGIITDLATTTITVVPSNKLILDLPHVRRIPILKPARQLLCLPQEWSPAKILVKNLLLLTLEAVTHDMGNKGVLLSIVPAQELFNDDSYSVFTAVNPDAQTLYVNGRSTSFTPHLTHNLILEWVDSYSRAEARNLML